MLGIFLDTETTGLDPRRHCPIEIAFQLIDLTTGDLLASYQSVITHSKSEWEMRDPSSIEVNEFTWDEVKKGNRIEEVREEIVALFTEFGVRRGEAFFICQNPSFDRGFFNHIVPVAQQESLLWPYHWLDLASMYWISRIFNAKEENAPIPAKVTLSKNEIARYFGLPPENTPHRAMNGVEHLIACYKAVTDSY